MPLPANNLVASFKSVPAMTQVPDDKKAYALMQHEGWEAAMNDTSVEELVGAVARSKHLLRHHCAHLTARYFRKYKLQNDTLRAVLRASNVDESKDGLVFDDGNVNLLALNDRELREVYMKTPEVHMRTYI